MPDFPIIDTHVHITNGKRVGYSWMHDAPEFNRDFGLDDFRCASETVDIAGLVFVEVDCDVQDRVKEVRWVTELKRDEAMVQGIVAQVPLEQGVVLKDELEVLAENTAVKGIRRLLQTEATDFCLQASFLEGLRLLPEFDLSFDICVYHQHLVNIVEMVRQCEEVRFVLDHAGKPDIRGQQFEPWKSHIQTLAGFPNVTCKISGMATEADHQNWKFSDLQPYIETVISCFGFDRVMYGGDWFVSTLATVYPRWVQVVDMVLQGCSDEEQRKLFRANAESTYRLGQDGI